MGIQLTCSIGEKEQDREKNIKGQLKGLNTYCLRKSANLEVRADISPRERRMSSLSLGSSHNSAIFRASAKAPRICSSPSGPPFGSASQFYRQKERILQSTHEPHLINLNKAIRKKISKSHSTPVIVFQSDNYYCFIEVFGFIVRLNQSLIFFFSFGSWNSNPRPCAC